MTTTTDEVDPGERTAIAFLGLGAMGSRMASRLADEGIDLRVWSRSGASAALGARASSAAPTAAHAVSGADVAIAMLTDDDASRQVWLEAGALGAMRPGATVVECSTLSPAWVSALAAHARDAGLRFVEAPVVGSRTHADAGHLSFLAGGEASVVDDLRPILERMGNTVHHVGPTPSGAYAKLLVNALFGAQVGVLAELLAVAARARVDTAALMQVLQSLPVLSAAAKGAAVGMLTRQFAPMFPVELAAKDLRYALAAAESVGGALPVTRVTSEIFERARAKGLGVENLTAVFKLYDG